MRLSFCFAAIIVAPYLASSEAQAASLDAPLVAVADRAPPPESKASTPSRIDRAHLVKRELRVGNRTIMVDQFSGDRAPASAAAL